MATYEQQKLGLSVYYGKRWVLPDEIHTESIEFHMTRLSWRQLCIWRDNQRLFADKLALRRTLQIVKNRLVRLCPSSFKSVDFQRPDRICSPFSPTCKLTRLVEITKIHVGGELFFRVHTNRPWVRSRRFCWKSVNFDCVSRFFASQASDFLVQRLSNVRKSFDPRSRTLARRQEHFHVILMTEQALGKRAIETFNNCLVSMNFSAPTANISFVVFHFFVHTSHKLAARINLQQLRPRQIKGCACKSPEKPSQLQQSFEAASD